MASLEEVLFFVAVTFLLVLLLVDDFCFVTARLELILTFFLTLVSCETI